MPNFDAEREYKKKNEKLVHTSFQHWIYSRKVQIGKTQQKKNYCFFQINIIKE